MNSFFENGVDTVGGKELKFEKRPIRGGFLMYIPKSFSEDKSIVSNYSYLFSKDKSPLSIAIKYSPVARAADREKMIALYFSNSANARFAKTEDAGEGVRYRETVAKSQYLSVYSLRFSIEVENGMLFGCFNCDADYMDDWRSVVLQMLCNIEPEANLADK